VSSPVVSAVQLLAMFGPAAACSARGIAEGLQLLSCSPTLAHMRDTTQTPKRLTRKQITEGLDTVPISGLLGGSSRELTAKQKAFAREVALGSTGADAYRKAYSSKGSSRTAGNNAAKIKAHTGVELEIQAIRRAQEAEHLKNPLALRALVISTLVELATNPDAKDATRLQAVKILGGVTEVAAFTERKETKVITSSTDARAEIMAELRALTNAHASDAVVIESQASELLAELKSAAEPTHPPPTPQDEEMVPVEDIHTIPPKPSPLFSESDSPPPQSEEDPPSSFLAK